MIDWNKQWELHAPGFKEGFVSVALKNYGGSNHSFRLAPGAGFGDLSHPTTRLMLSLMPKEITAPVIDVGCGSGVLSLAAKTLGAPSVLGIDIDPAAIEHSQKNAKLNELECIFDTKIELVPPSPLILMNMISSEQRIAWDALPSLGSYTLIVSGYLEDEAAPTHYGTITASKTLEGWKAFAISYE
ncbi:50S ribosomal protein L11 methyltransferase [Candidatus Neptunochlamydia vexilliferae]|uniref:Ribosomal protein L11 methyltransferase n=1 Tax=Candidatus Neptunichlamydia vexilliferae TaxID=1651774 RepID=A0ABS0B321_9BACT|nr:50S ribosomal protein L11 methyltransferase [Candidatus Neptunochlamydia vexilliferae]MBF5059980.1 hypothetical protein [Candidatus Neptunochlamydia vexilliferae]